MDDFLYNLRRETDKRNRRQGGQQSYRGPDRRGSKDQRRGYTRRNDMMDQFAEMLPEIKSLLETIGENHKQLLGGVERNTLALENIAASLRIMSGNTQPIASLAGDTDTIGEAVAETPIATPSQASPSTDSAEVTAQASDAAAPVEKPRKSKREDVRKIALELRAQGKTYKEIAQQLDDEKVPTFSGKGGWHAPTIHKLCK